MSEIVHTELLKETRLIGVSSNPNVVIIRMTTAEGEDFNFTVPVEYMPMLMRQWVFDLKAIQATKESGSPMPGKPLGQPERKLL